MAKPSEFSEPPHQSGPLCDEYLNKSKKPSPSWGYVKSSKYTWNCTSELENSTEHPPWFSKLFWQNKLTGWWIHVSETHTVKILEDACQKWDPTLIAELVSFFTSLHINICAYTYSSYIHNWLSHCSTIEGMCNFYHRLLPFFLLYKSGLQVSLVLVVVSWPSYFYNFLTFFNLQML